MVAEKRGWWCCRRSCRRRVDTLPRWVRLTTKLYRVRRLQRIWAVLGQYLQILPQALRWRVQGAHPNERPQRR